MRIFLSGPMGSGKSTVARELGELAGLAVIDLDERIARAAGRSVSEIFRERGEAAFRELERVSLGEVLSEHDACVVALGGGAVTNAALRRTVLARGVCVTLSAPVAVLAQRVGSGHSRPLLGGHDVLERLRQLGSERAAAYAECHLRIDTGVFSPRAAAQAIWRVAQDPPVVVALGTRTYRIEVGAGVHAQLLARVRELGDVSSALLVTDSEVGPHWAAGVADALQAAGLHVTSVTLPPGENEKTLASVETLWNAALDAGVDRRTLVVGLGGGVIGDLCGFAAATLLRGVRVAHLPTTLLAMVDSSVGGKTGFDTRHGKNLIGAFHQPSFVLADVDTLRTLPQAERRAGLAEVVKSAWIDGEAQVAQLEADAAALAAGRPDAVVRAITMSVQLKARIVTEDEHEAGSRALLNLGHTLGHAIEAAQGYGVMRHGEAVALGMVAAFRVAMRLGRIDASVAARARRLLENLGLPTQVDTYLSDHVLSFLGSDKKRAGTTLSYVVPGPPGQVEVVKLPQADVAALLRSS